MYVLELNVGLDVSDNFPTFKKLGITSIYTNQVVDLVKQVLSDAGIENTTYFAYRVDKSETEKTAIVKLKFETKYDASRFVARLVTTFKYTDSIGQDCIAIYNPIMGEGTLFGRYADAWGEFNKAYFIGF